MSNYQPKFIGRETAINYFRSIVVRVPQKNVLYLTAEGGLGKTWLLREYFEHHAGTAWRRWHVHPTATPMAWDAALIDFYRLENRSIPGLRRSMVERIGREFFEEFLKADAAGNEIAAESWFFAGLQAARRQIENYIVLFFDTFETVYNLPAGRWFLETFLPHKAVQGYLIVFAGRPRDFALPANVAQYELPTFDAQESTQYFEQKFGVSADKFGESERQIIQNSRGKPLLFDLWTHYAHPTDDSDALLEPPERRLVKRFFEDPSPEGELLRSLAYLTRRFNREIFAAAGLRGDYDGLEAALKNYPFVKYRPGEHRLTLHDEFQRMLAEYGKHLSEIWNKQLYSKVVQGWYTAQIHDLQKPPQQRFLFEAEYLAYLLEHNANDGLTYFEQKFEDEIKLQAQFERRSLLWSAVAAFLDAQHEAVAPEQLFRLYQMQGDWLYDKGRYAEAAYELHAALHERFATVRPFEEWSRLAVRLGHCYLQTKRMEATEQLWQAGLAQAQQRGAREQEQTFIYNLAHILNRRERLTQAIEYYEKAIQLARELELKQAYIEASYTCAPLQATTGASELAHKKTKLVMALLEDSKDKFLKEEYARVSIHIADTYRYLDKYKDAKEQYNKIKDILPSLSPPWQIRALTGEAAARLSLVREQGNSGSERENPQEIWKLFKDSLAIARSEKISPYRLFDRFARFYSTFHDRGQTDFPIGLYQEASELSLSEETLFLGQTADASQSFATLPDFLARAQRLSELTYFLAIEQSHFHFSLNALLDAAIVAARRSRWNDLDGYQRRVYALQGIDTKMRSEFFTNLFKLLKVYPWLAQQDYSRAIPALAERAISVVNTPGSGPYYLRNQWLIIKHYLQLMSPEQQQKYLPVLIESWQNSPEPLKDASIEINGILTELKIAQERLYWS